MSNVFRKSAMERLASPEQLDKALVITSPLSWLALVGIALIFTTVIVWSIFGSLPTMVTATGVLIDSKRVSSIKESGNIVVCYVPLTEGKSLQLGMETLIAPISVDRQKFGHMEGEIVYIDEYITAIDSIRNTLGEDNMLADQFMNGGPVVAVTCKLKTDERSDNGFYWSNRNGRNVHLSEGMLLVVNVITQKTAPISKLFHTLGTEE